MFKFSSAVFFVSFLSHKAEVEREQERLVIVKIFISTRVRENLRELN